MRILADTNVIIDALTSREPWNKSAEEIFLMAANHTIEMYVYDKLNNFVVKSQAALMRSSLAGFYINCAENDFAQRG